MQQFLELKGRYLIDNKNVHVNIGTEIQDPVVQSIVSLTISLRHKFVKQISAKVTNTLFLLKKCENPLQCKGFSHFFNKKITVYL